MNQNLSYTLMLRDLFSRTMSGAANQTSRLDSRMARLQNRMSGLSSAIGGIAATAGIVKFGSDIKESLVNYEYFSAALRTMLRGDVNAANALQGQLVQLAKTTPFQLTEVQDATKQLLAYGFQAGNVVSTMRMLGDVSAAVGAPMGDIAYLYGTLKTSGRVTLMDLRQFAGRGIPIYETLAKRLNVTTGAINSMVSAGKIGFSDVEGAFKDMTGAGGQFFNMMDTQSKTVGGRLSNMSDAWEQMKVNIGKSQTGIIASTTAWVNNFLDKTNQILEAANRMDEAFSKANVKGYSAFETLQNNLFFGSTNKYLNFLSGGKGKMEMLDRSIQNMYVNPSGKDKMGALTANADILKLKSNFGKAFINKEIDKNEYDRSMALFEQAQKTIQGNLSLFNGAKTAPGMGVEGGNEGAKSSGIGSGVEVSGNRPQNLTININDGLVKNFTISTTNLPESTAKVKTEVSKALLEAVNDVNFMQR